MIPKRAQIRTWALAPRLADGYDSDVARERAIHYPLTVLAFSVPPSLRPGALVEVVAPAGPFDRAELFRGLAWLRLRYRLRISSRVLCRTGYLAGEDLSRAQGLARAMTDPAVEAIVCARGGYGAMRILDALPWDAFVADPKWIVGFSDITALHLEAARRNVCSMHSMNVTGIGRNPVASERLALIDALEGRTPRSWTDLEILHPNAKSRMATGPLVGGNLALVVSMAAAGRFVVPDDAIVLLEDVTERPYRVDRMLTSLRLGNHFVRASAIVFGSFTQCEAGADGVTVADVLRERTADLGIPVYAGAPFGHGEVNQPFVLGRMATVDGTTLHYGV